MYTRGRGQVACCLGSSSGSGCTTSSLSTGVLHLGHGGVHLLSIFVVADADGGSTVATAAEGKGRKGGERGVAESLCRLVRLLTLRGFGLGRRERGWRMKRSRPA